MGMLISVKSAGAVGPPRGGGAYDANLFLAAERRASDSATVPPEAVFGSGLEHAYGLVVAPVQAQGLGFVDLLPGRARRHCPLAKYRFPRNAWNVLLAVYTEHLARPQ